MVDMAHFAGLVAGGVHPSPFPHAHVVTTTTHKTLRGPRGGAILTNDEELAKKLNSAVFPGMQGGPLMHVIAAKAVAFGEALRPVVQALREERRREREGACGNAEIQRPRHHLRRHRYASHAGRSADEAPDRQGGRERRSAARTSPATRTAFRSIRKSRRSRPGVRLGTPAGTTRGFGIAEFRQVGDMIAEVLDALARKANGGRRAAEASVRDKVKRLVGRFPIYEG